MLKILLRQQGETSKTDDVVGKPGSLFPLTLLQKHQGENEP